MFFSCQEEITLDLPQAENKLVVEGAIEPGYPPYVILTKNQGYFDPIDTNTYTNLFIEDVDSIKVWYYNDNGEEVTRELSLIPPEITEALFSVAFPIYTVTDTVGLLNGNYDFSQAGRTYFLEIKWNDELITSSTTIPDSTPLDCLWVEQNPNTEANWWKESTCDIRAIYSDDANIQNNILIKSKRLEHWQKKKHEESVVNKNDPMLLLVDAGSDVLINGETFETIFLRPKNNGEFPPFASYQSNRYKTFDNNGIQDSVFLNHDIVLIKFCQIDESSMKFWRGLVRQAGTNGNPFSEPMNLVSNINNGLGVWTGYGSIYYKVPIVKDTVIKQQYTPDIIDIF
jgi:hypothetical protein